MSAHTPGPWIVDGNVIRGDEQRNGSVSVACVLDVAYPYGRRAGESAQANARLIAAAPDLLEALRMVMACAGDISAAPDGLLEMALDDGDEETRRQANAFLVARAAIAKTTGGTA